MTVYDASGRPLLLDLTDIEIANGDVPHVSGHAKFGKVAEIDSADTPVDVWHFADDTLSNRQATKTFPSAAATLYMASDNAGDTATVSIEYLDSSGNSQSVSAALTGQTAVNLGVSALDVNRAYLSGDDESNAGNIYISHDADWTSGVPDDLTQTLAFIGIGYGQTEQCIYRVPTGKRAILIGSVIGIARANGADGSAVIQLVTKEASGSWLVKRHWHLQTGNGIYLHLKGLTLDAGGIFKMHVNGVSDNGTNITGEVHYYLVDV